MRASRLTNEKARHAAQNLLFATFEGLACLSARPSGSPDTENEQNSMRSTYGRTRSMVNGLLSAEAGSLSAVDAPTDRSIPLRQVYPGSPLRPSQFSYNLMSSASSPRASPRTIRARGPKPHTIFAKKKTAKKSVRWRDDGDEGLTEDVATTGDSSPGNLRMKPDFLSKRRSIAQISSPPSLPSNSDRALSPLDGNAGLDIVCESPFVDIQATECVTEDFGHAIHGKPRQQKPFRSTLSGLAVANLTIETDNARRSINKENIQDKAGTEREGRRITSIGLGGAVRQSLAGKGTSKSGAWR